MSENNSEIKEDEFLDIEPLKLVAFKYQSYTTRNILKDVVT